MYHQGKAFVHGEVIDASNTPPEKKVYKCLSCGYLFGNLSDLKRHLKIRHHVHMQDIAGMEQMQISEVEVSLFLTCLSTIKPVELFCSLYFFRRCCEVLWEDAVYVLVAGMQ